MGADTWERLYRPRHHIYTQLARCPDQRAGTDSGAFGAGGSIGPDGEGLGLLNAEDGDE